MIARHWEMVYGRPPVSLDAVLFAVAVALHLPLLFLHMKAPPKALSGAEPEELVVGFERIETYAKLPAVPPRTLPPRLPETVNLAQALGAIGRPSVSVVPPRHRVELPAVIVPVVPPPVPIAPTVGNDPSIAGTPVSDVPATISGLRHGTPGVPGPGGPGNGSVAPADKGSFGKVAGDIRVDRKDGLAVAGAETLVIPIPGSGPPGGGTLMASKRTEIGRAGRVKFPEEAPVVDKTLPVGRAGGVADTIPVKPTEVPQYERQRRVVSVAPTEFRGEGEESLFPIVGALKGRKLLYQELPEYPEWARRRGVDASVTFTIVVLPDGRVKDTIVIEKPSGYPELDSLAQKAVARWLFAPLPEGVKEEQIGEVEIRFEAE